MLADQLDQEEVEVKQSSQVNWLHLEEANTCFFMGATREKIERNSLIYNLDQSGMPMTTQPQMIIDAIDYFTRLFRACERPGRVLQHRWIPYIVTEEANRIARLPLEAEIKNVVMSLSLDKALGLDGFTRAFF